MRFFSRVKEASLLRRLRATHTLSLYNTLSGSLETFSPLSSSVVKMYNCGPTVYDRQHIGNLRPYVFADTLKRVLSFHGYKVDQVINITDVGHLTSDSDEGEDKMEVGARREGKAPQEIAQEVTEAFFEDLDALNIDRGSIRFPKATEYIEAQIALVQTLKERSYAYKTEDGIYFDTSRFKEYGKLGKIDLAGLEEGARIGVVAGKRNPSDFALWKFSKPKDKRLQEWDSPWGKGFPGWHIECTAMIFKLLGRQIDIHTGGIDHIPVHHQNEIAQAESITGRQYAKYWMHNAFITIEGKKVSKSLGNTIYLRSIIDHDFPPLALRYWFLTGHYRSPINFTWDALEGSSQAYRRLYRLFFEELAVPTGTLHEPFANAFVAAISHDLDTPKAIALLWDMVKDEKITKADKRANILFADRILGLGLTKKSSEEASRLTVIPAKDLPQEVRSLVAERETARAEKRYEDADRLRDSIEILGFTVTDTAEGSSVRKK